MLRFSEIVVMVERNLGFEAEHHERHFSGAPNLRFRVDHAAKRFGVLTTEDIKYGMCTLLNTMLREQRVSIAKPLISERPGERPPPARAAPCVLHAVQERGQRVWQAAPGAQWQGGWHEG